MKAVLEKNRGRLYDEENGWKGTVYVSYRFGIHKERDEFFGLCRQAARIAEEAGVTLCMERHRNTYTQTKEGALERIPCGRYLHKGKPAPARANAPPGKNMPQTEK